MPITYRTIIGPDTNHIPTPLLPSGVIKASITVGIGMPYLNLDLQNVYMTIPKIVRKDEFNFFLGKVKFRISQT